MTQSSVRSLVAAAVLAALGTGFAGSAVAADKKAPPEIPKCEKKVGTMAVTEPENKWWTALNLESPEALIKVFVSQSGCFTLVDRGKGLAAAALFAATISIMAVTWSDSLFWAKVLAIPSGLLGGGWAIGIMASLQYLLPDRFRATGTALFIMVTTFLGFVVGPWLTGALSQYFGDGDLSLRWALTIVIPTGLIGAVLAALAARHLESDRTRLSGPDVLPA